MNGVNGCRTLLSTFVYDIVCQSGCNPNQIARGRIDKIAEISIVCWMNGSSVAYDN
jgi:hypothetical protein